MRTAQRAPRPPFWAYGGNVQFMPWMMYNLCQSRSGYNGPSSQISQWDIPCFFWPYIDLILALYGRIWLVPPINRFLKWPLSLWWWIRIVVFMRPPTNVESTWLYVFFCHSHVYIYRERERWVYKPTNINIHKCIIASNPIPDKMKFIFMADMSPF